MYTLEFISGNRAGQHLTVAREVFVIGNSPAADLTLPEVPEGTRVTLHAEPAGLKVVLEGDAHVEGREESGSLRLRYGDRVRLGSTSFKYVPTSVVWEGAEEERRINHVQGITFGLVVLVILVEASLLVGLSVFRVDRQLTQAEATAEAELPAVQQETSTAAVPEPESPTMPEVPAALETVETQHPPETSPIAAALESPEPESEAAAPPPEPPPEEVAAPAVSPAASIPGTAGTAEEPELPAVEKQKVEGIWPAVADPENPLHRIAAEMVATALVEVLRHNYVEAHRQFERARILAPDYYPAYAEQAQLFENEGNLEQAGKLWEEILKRCQHGPWYELASRERHRLARKAARRAVPALPPPQPRQVLRELPREVRLEKVELQDAGAANGFREIKLLNIQLKSRIGHTLRDASVVRVRVQFYQRDPSSGAVVPARALVPQPEIPLRGVWRVGESRNLSAAYLARPPADPEQKPLEFYGYVVKVFYQDQLQDQTAEPESLLRLEAQRAEG